MRRSRRWAAALAGTFAISTLAGAHVMAGQDAIRIDMTGLSEDAWANIAMANDDTVDTGVNIRKAADTDSEIEGYLYRGGAVYVLNKGEQWSEVTSGSVTGYIRNEYLTFGEEAKGLAEYYGSYAVKASWDDINIFADESGDAKIIQTAGDGDTFRLIGKNGSWMQLEAGENRTAYVPAEDVSLVMVVDSAVAVGEPHDISDSVFTEVAGTVSAAAASEEDNCLSGQTGEETISYEEGTSVSAYDEASGYADSSYDDHSSDWYASRESYDTATSEDNEYSEYSDTATDETSTSVSASAYTEEPVNTQGSADELEAQANNLYQKYLDAQAAADQAVASGAGEQAINDTAAAAVAAYSTYLKAQDLADQAAWGQAADAGASSGTSADGQDTSYDTSADYTETEGSSYEDTSAYDDGTADTYYDDSTADTYYDDSSSSTYQEEASDSSQSSVSDLELLAALIYCEAGNQPYEGQVAVGAVVMNRVYSSSFPNTIYEVINQSGQFTPSYTGVLASALANGSGAGYIGAASDAMAGSDPTGGCLYFNNHQGSGLKIGDHWFF